MLQKSISCSRNQCSELTFKVCHSASSECNAEKGIRYFNNPAKWGKVMMVFLCPLPPDPWSVGKKKNSEEKKLKMKGKFYMLVTNSGYAQADLDKNLRKLFVKLRRSFTGCIFQSDCWKQLSHLCHFYFPSPPSQRIRRDNWLLPKKKKV